MRRAFTLLELLLVLAIIALGSAVVAVRLGGLRPTQAVDQAAQQVLDQTWRCRRLAQSNGILVRLRIEAEQKTATVQVLGGAGVAGTGGVGDSAAGTSAETDPPDALPVLATLYEGAEDLTATFQRDDGVISNEAQIDVLFRPDGRCDPPGLLTLTCAGQVSQVRYPAGLRPPLRTIPTDLAVVRP